MDKNGHSSQKIRCNVSVAAATILGVIEAAGYEIGFIDVSAEGNSYLTTSAGLLVKGLTDQIVTQRIADFRPNVILITSMFVAEQFMVDRLVCICRMCAPNCQIVVGGIHASSRPEWHFDDAAPDFVVIGDGEETVVELLAALSDPEARFENIPGLMFRNSVGELVRTDPRIKLEGLTKPWALDVVLRCADGRIRYRDVDCRKSPLYGTGVGDSDAGTFVLFASRGCPFSCGYCTSTRRTGNQITHMGADMMFTQFRSARETYGVSVFANQADTFGQHPADLEFLRRVADYRATTTDSAFVLNNPNAFFLRRFFSRGPNPEIDENFIRLLKAAGFNVVTIAVETTIQRFNHKITWSRITQEHALDLARAIRAAGMHLDVYMMFGFPGETELEFGADIRFGQQIARVADAVTWHKVSLLPDTEFYDSYIVKAGLEGEYRRFVQTGQGSCFFRDTEELNLSEISSERMRAAVNEFGPGWFEETEHEKRGEHA